MTRKIRVARMLRTRSRAALAGVALVAAAAAASSQVPTDASAAPVAQTVTAAADTYASSQNATTVHGALAYVKADASPDRRVYVRFVVPSLPGAVTQAVLRFWSQSTGTAGIAVHGVPDTSWQESTLTYGNAPEYRESVTGLPGPFASVSFASGAWVSVDVTPLVRGAGAVGFAATTTSTAGVQFASLQGGAATAPQLVVTADGATGGSPPVNTSPPAITGPAQEGQAQTVTPGTWSGDVPMTVGRQWQLCDSAGASCGPIANATGTSYTPVTSDVGGTLKVVESASNASGSATATSAASPVIQSAATGGSFPVVMAAGDIACGTKSTGASCKQMATSDLLVGQHPAAVLPLGDDQYECGGLADFQNFYDPSWGRVKSVTRPSVGNHEYSTSTSSTSNCFNSPPGAEGYFRYFGNAATPLQPGCIVSCKGYYSYDVGSWHLIAINSNCTKVGGCGPGSPMETWLRSDLAATRQKCVLAYWHHPRWSSGQLYQEGTKLHDIWNDLYDAHADIVLNGHDHDYERFAQLGRSVSGAVDPTLDPNGIREFVVGTGGRNRTSFSTSVKTGSEVRNSATYGVLKLVLRSSSYDWTFVPIAGSTFSDAGSTACH
jgi:hypothetical protein